MDPLTFAIFEALLSTAGSLGIAAGAARAVTTSSRKVAGALQRRLDAARLSTLATVWDSVPEKNVDEVFEFLKTAMGRHVMRTIVVAMLTRASEVAPRTVEAITADRGKHEDPLITLLDLGMRLSQTVDESVIAECSKALYDATKSVVSDVAAALKALKPEEYRDIRASLIADRQSDLILNVSRANGTLHDLIHVDTDAAHAFARRLRPLIHDASATVTAPYFQKRPPVPYEEIYVPPSLARSSASEEILDGLGDEEGTETLWEVDDLLKNLYRDVILGNPGAGKSTISYFLAHKVSAPDYQNGAIVPFVVSIRDYDKYRSNSGITLCEYIAQTCRRDYQMEPPPSSVEFLCATGCAVVLLDGLDEVLEPHDRQEVVSAVNNFSSLYPAASILVTSRLIGYDQAPLYAKVFNQTVLRPFTDKQVRLYAKQWFNGEPDMSEQDRNPITQAFLDEVSTIGEDLRTNPLTLGLLCNVYRRIRSIPQNRAELYEECANLLFERWDRSRGIVSEGALRVEAREALQDVALWMYTRADSSKASEARSSEEIISAVHSSARGMTVGRSDLRRRLIKYWGSRLDSVRRAEEMTDALIQTWEGRAWILTDVGSDLEESRFGFSHQTFLEYFAATQLVRKNPTPKKLADALIPRLSAGAWDVVGEIAIQVIHRNVQDGCDKLVKRLLKASNDLGAVAQAAVVGFTTRHLDSLPLGAGSIRVVVSHAVRLFLLAQPALSEMPTRHQYDDALWFRRKIGWVSELPYDEDEDDLPNTISAYLTMSEELLSEEQFECLALALPALALMRCRVPEVVELAQDESRRELVRICSDDTDTSLASSALLVLLKPGQLDFGFLQVYSSIRPAWSFLSACMDVLERAEAGEHCRRLAGANFLIQVIAAGDQLISTADLLDLPCGWKSLFVCPPEWLDGLPALVPGDTRSPSPAHCIFSGVASREGTGTDTVPAGHLADSLSQLGVWVLSNFIIPRHVGSVDSRLIDRAWMEGCSVYSVLDQASLQPKNAGETGTNWDAPEEPFSNGDLGYLVAALGDAGMLGMFFIAMVDFEAGSVAPREIFSGNYGPLAGLADLLNCRLDGVPFLRDPWPGASRWEHCNHVAEFFTKWSSGQISFVADLV